ncbi:MAG: cyclic pyranopterin monophosphate synthase MoaC [Peptostreptococcaceae bacterium]
MNNNSVTASCEVLLGEDTYNQLISNKIKVNVFEVSKTSAIMASKSTFLYLPNCFQNNINSCDIEFELDSKNNKIKIFVTATSINSSSVEMETLYACSNCALVICDLLKKYDKNITINNLSIISKSNNTTEIKIEDKKIESNENSGFRFLINEI